MKMTFEKFKKCLKKNPLGNWRAPENYQMSIDNNIIEYIAIVNQYCSDEKLLAASDRFYGYYAIGEEFDFKILRTLDVTPMFQPVFDKE